MSLAGILLAGGRSRRMGCDKALLDWHGSPLVMRTSGLLARHCQPVIVVHAAGQALPRLKGVVTAVDEHPDRGPLQGLATGLRELGDGAELAFVAGVDHPFLHPALVRCLTDAIGQADVAVPLVDGRTHQLIACYRTSVLTLVDDLLERDRLAVSGLLDVARVVALDRAELLADADLAAFDPHLDSLRNVNDPAAYAAALAEPEPEITVEGVGVLRAATLTRALRAAGVSVDVDVDTDVPLVTGDRISIAGWRGPPTAPAR